MAGAIAAVPRDIRAIFVMPYEAGGGKGQISLAIGVNILGHYRKFLSSGMRTTARNFEVILGMIYRLLNRLQSAYSTSQNLVN